MSDVKKDLDDLLITKGLSVNISGLVFELLCYSKRYNFFYINTKVMEELNENLKWSSLFIWDAVKRLLEAKLIIEIDRKVYVPSDDLLKIRKSIVSRRLF